MGCSSSKPNTHFSAELPSSNPSPSSSSSSASASLSHSQSSNSSPPVPRAVSLPTSFVHHPPLRKGDTRHLVSLTSTTYGSLLHIDPPKPHQNPTFKTPIPQPDPYTNANPEEQQHSLSPVSVINTWELMDGLEDDCELPSSSIFDRPTVIQKRPSSCRYPNSDGSVPKLFDLIESTKKSELLSQKSSSSVKPLWQHLSEEALLSKMDPNVVSSYRRALSSRQLNYTTSTKGIARSLGSSPMTSCYSFSNSWYSLPGCEDKVVIYFTSLRGIRKTYEDCCSVRMILRGFRVPVDERDISMDAEYRKELQRALGGKAMSLPQVFIRGKYVGGAEEVKQLNEVGELSNLLEGFPMRDPGSVCVGCGDARFVPCPNCNGSRKVFEEEEGELKRCPDCNENGLIRCPGCCCS